MPDNLIFIFGSLYTSISCICVISFNALVLLISMCNIYSSYIIIYYLVHVLMETFRVNETYNRAIATMIK